MRTQFIYMTTFMLAVVILSCSENKEAQLIRLKKQQQELSSQIHKIEEEINNDSTIAKKTTNGIAVRVEKMIPSVFEHMIEVHGKLDGEENIQVFPKGQGVIQYVYVKLGSTVKKGQIIASLDAGALQKQLDQAKSQYDLAREMFERQQRLWDQKIGSEIQYLQAKANKEALENGVAALEEQLDYMKIKSPIDGTIEDLPIKVGMSVSPAMPAATVINFSTLKVVAEIAEAYGTRVKSGDSVVVFFPDIRKEIKGTIATASNYINQVNRTFKIEVRLTEPSSFYKANMIAVVRIIDYKNPLAMKIPVNLIQTDSRGNYVYVAQSLNDRTIAEKKYIQQGLSYNGMVEISNGLVPGDHIIVSGYQSVFQGSSIQY